MTNLDALWVQPSELDPELVLEEIDPDDAQLLRDYYAALDACEFASQILWALSGRKYHTGTIPTEHYVVDRNYQGITATDTPRGMAVYDRNIGVYLVDPSDWRARRIRLDGTPVISIGSVTELGTGRLLNPTEYAIVNRNFLHISTSIISGVDVSYTYGQRPPAAGRRAAKTMAQQFYYLWSGREDQCELPSRVTQVNRQGVDWTLLDNQDFLDELKTGIYAVDMFLRSVNPDRARVRAKVFSVDLPRGRRRSL